MLDPMAKPFPYLQRERSRHGLTTWYVRIGDGPRVRVKGEYGTPEFAAAHKAALASLLTECPQEAIRRPHAGSLAWLAERYRETSAWADLSAATRRQRDNIFKRLLAESGSIPFVDIARKDIVATLDKRRDKAAAGRHFLETVRGLFKWALDAELIDADPTAGIRTMRRKSDGHPPWTDEDCARYEARWPLGTRERVAYAVLIETGLRRGDAVIFGKQHIRNGIATIRTEKTGEVVSFAITRALATATEAGPCGDLTFIAGEGRQPLTKETFGNWFRKACRASSVAKSAHGLRKTAATRHALDGATELELMARYGWSEPRTAAIYTRKANRERLALSADAKSQTARNGNTESPHRNAEPRTEKKIV